MKNFLQDKYNTLTIELNNISQIKLEEDFLHEFIKFVIRLKKDDAFGYAIQELNENTISLQMAKLELKLDEIFVEVFLELQPVVEKILNTNPSSRDDTKYLNFLKAKVRLISSEYKEKIYLIDGRLSYEGYYTSLVGLVKWLRPKYKKLVPSNILDVISYQDEDPNSELNKYMRLEDLRIAPCSKSNLVYQAWENINTLYSLIKLRPTLIFNKEIQYYSRIGGNYNREFLLNDIKVVLEHCRKILNDKGFDYPDLKISKLIEIDPINLRVKYSGENKKYRYGDIIQFRAKTQSYTLLLGLLKAKDTKHELFFSSAVSMLKDKDRCDNPPNRLTDQYSLIKSVVNECRNLIGLTSKELYYSKNTGKIVLRKE